MVLTRALVLALVAAALSTACVSPALQARGQKRLACSAKRTTVDFDRDTDEGEVVTFCCRPRPALFNEDPPECVTYFCPRGASAAACVEDT